MPGKPKRYFLKEKESKELLERASQRLKVSLEQVFGEKTSVEVVETAFGDLCLIGGKPALVATETAVYPTLVSEELFELLPRIIVDMGAVKFVCKGADIMAPGIKGFKGDFSKGDIVFVVDEKHGKPLALGKAKYDSDEAKNAKHGKVVENVHYVGDIVWENIKSLGTKTR